VWASGKDRKKREKKGGPAEVNPMFSRMLPALFRTESNGREAGTSQHWITPSLSG
jgi:hypothetical protein